MGEIPIHTVYRILFTTKTPFVDKNKFDLIYYIRDISIY